MVYFFRMILGGEFGYQLQVGVLLAYLLLHSGKHKAYTKSNATRIIISAQFSFTFFEERAFVRIDSHMLLSYGNEWSRVDFRVPYTFGIVDLRNSGPSD